MQIEGTLRSNLIAAVASARRLRDHPVHGDTIAYWRQLLDYARKVSIQPRAELFDDLMTELEAELARSKAA
jgi:phage gp29-like protein